MKDFIQSLFAYNRRQQRGIVALLLILIIALAVRFYIATLPSDKIVLEDTSPYQAHVDSIKKVLQRRKDTIYAFNPNFITDYRGYKLGLSVEELDRLFRFRESGKFINSKRDFKEVTGVSDRWLDSISPYFKFPDWVINPRKKRSFVPFKDRKIVRTDINLASAAQLRKVYGIGPALSKRLVEERNRLNSFIAMEQIAGVYGISDSTMIQIQKHFYLNPPAGFKKLALNTATRDQLLTIPYFNDYLVDGLIKQRRLRDGFESWEKVMLTSRFPQEKLPLIQLYLTLD
ncbi:MAG: helix-hairpin-helix domain-containing protein [Nonlabens sp.]